MKPRLLVTRPAAQAGELVALLGRRGIDSVAVPTVEIDAESSAPELDRALDALDGVDWLVITSANGAEALVARLRARDGALPAGIRVAAVGPTTAAALALGGIAVDHVPSDYLTVEIAGGLGPVRGRRVVLARADTATTDLRAELVARGAITEEIVAYRTIEGPAGSRDRLRAALAERLDGVTFTSGSTVRGLLRLASTVDRHRARSLPAFCIGPVTAEVARLAGFDIAAVADPHTAEALADAIFSHFARPTPTP